MKERSLQQGDILPRSRIGTKTVGEENSPSRIKTILIIVNCSLFLVVSVLSISFYWIAKPRLERYFTRKLQQMLPEGMKYERVHVELYPMGLYIDDLTFQQMPTGTFSIPRIRIEPNLMRLLDRKIKIDSIRVERPNLSLPLGSQTGSLKRIPSVFHRVQKRLRQMPLFETTIGVVRIQNGTMNIRTASSSAHPVIQLEKLNFQMGPFSFPRGDQPIPFEGTTRLMQERIDMSLSGQVGSTWSTFEARGNIQGTRVPWKTVQSWIDSGNWIRSPHSTLEGTLPFRWKNHRVSIGKGTLRLKNLKTRSILLPNHGESTRAARWGPGLGVRVDAGSVKVPIHKARLTWTSPGIEQLRDQNRLPITVETVELGTVQLTKPRLRMVRRPDTSPPGVAPNDISSHFPLGDPSIGMDSLVFSDAELQWDSMNDSNPFRRVFDLEMGPVSSLETGDSIPLNIQWGPESDSPMKWVGTIRDLTSSPVIEGTFHLDSLKLPSVPFLSGSSNLRHKARIRGKLPVELRGPRLRVGEGWLHLSHVSARRMTKKRRGNPNRRNRSYRAMERPSRSMMERARRIQIDVEKANFRIDSDGLTRSDSGRSSFLRMERLVLKSFELNEPLFNVVPTRSSSFRKRLRQWLGRLGSYSSAGRPIRIRRLRINKGSVRLQSHQKNREITLENVSLTAGADTSKPAEVVTLNARGGLNGCSSCLRLTAESPGHSTRLRGQFRLDGVPVQSLSEKWFPGLGCRYATFSGNLPFTVERDYSSFGNVNLRLENALFEAPDATGLPDPGNLRQLIQRMYSPAWLPRSIDLTLKNIRWKPTGEETRKEIILDRAHFQIGGSPSIQDPFFVLGELHMSKPRINFSIDGDLTPPESDNQLQLSGHLDLPDLTTFNRYLVPSHDFPFAIQSGQLISDVQGHVNLRRLDLRTGLHFKNLSLTNTDPERSEFLKTSITFLLFYLYQSGGALDVRLAIEGPYHNPRITRLD